MVQSLKIQSLIDLATTLWEKNEPNKRGLDANEIIAKYREVAHKIGQQIKTLALPQNLESELMLGISELGTNEAFKKVMMHAVETTVFSDSSRMSSNEDDRPCPSQHLLSVELLERHIRSFFVKPSKWLESPDLDEWFPDKHNKHIALKLFFALTIQNPWDERTLIRHLWRSPTFVPSQTIFLDNFIDIWDCISRDTRGETRLSRELRTWYSMDTDAVSTLWYLCMFRFPVNEMIPWFVFDVLTPAQRDKFLALGQSSLMEGDPNFQHFFETIFIHWPWQDEAFDMYFAKKEKLSNNDMFLLKSILKRLDPTEEGTSVLIELLPGCSPFYLKMKNFYNDAKKEAKSRGLNELETLRLSDD